MGLVKGVGFDSWRRVGSVMPSIKVYNLREVDELILLDITATEENREIDFDSVSEFSQECFVPFTVGGGITKIEQIKKLLRAGADKVAINSAAYDSLELIKNSAELFGSQCIVAGIDFRLKADGNYECFRNRGQIATGRDPVKWAIDLEKNGAGEILLTSIERDGSMKGYDLELIRRVSSAVKIPVIASGGAANYDDMTRAIRESGASAVSAGAIYHFTEQTPLEAKRAMAQAGILVRH